VREHGREAHGITNFDDNMRRKVQQSIHDRHAA
jgi:predicted small metal-binding protein